MKDRNRQQPISIAAAGKKRACRLHPPADVDEGSTAEPADLDCGGGKEGGLRAGPAWQSIRGGVLGCCPNCGRGRLFRAFLKVGGHSAICSEALTPPRADAAPAYF